MTTPTTGFRAETERGGRLGHTLFELTVTHPASKTWYLATVDLAPPETGVFDPSTFAPGVFAVGWGGEPFLGLVKEHSGVAAAAALGGVGGAAGVTLTLIDALGTGGPRRRFSDAFATNVSGYMEPYDLLTATLVCRLWWASLPMEPLTIGGALALLPDGFSWDAPGPDQPPTFTLGFGPDTRRYRSLPRHAVTTRRYPHVPDTSTDRAIPLWFGADLRVPLLALDPDGGLFLIGASPTATPLGGVTKLWTVRPDPGSDDSTPVALPVQLTTAGQAVLTLAGGTNLVLKQAAQRYEIDGDGVFASGVTVRLKRVAGAGAGSITLSVVLDQDGLPGETLVDGAATSEVDAAIVSSGSYADYTIPFQSNSGVGRAAFIPGNRGVWVVLKYAKAAGGGDLHLEVDGAGTYTQGMLATQDATANDEWILVGKQQRRGPVRQDFTGGGHLRRNVATGEIVTRPPVTVPGS